MTNPVECGGREPWNLPTMKELRFRRMVSDRLYMHDAEIPDRLHLVDAPFFVHLSARSKEVGQWYLQPRGSR